MSDSKTANSYNPFKREITIDGQEYEIATKQGSGVVNAIIQSWEKLGKPDTPLSDAGEKLMKVIIATWEDTYPMESDQWYADRRDYKNAELTISEQVHQNTGRSLASYPYYIYIIMKKVFPEFKLAERETVLKFVKKYPMFLMANRI